MGTTVILRVIAALEEAFVEVVVEAAGEEASAEVEEEAAEEEVSTVALQTFKKGGC